MKNYTLRVQEVIRETDDAVTLCFKQPGLKKIKYLPGQYLTLQFRINGRLYIRSYSFSSAPKTDTTLNVTVKRVQGGTVSNYINDTIQVDDVIEVQEPLGDFIYQYNSSTKAVFFWGAGSGITPLYSMIKELLIESSTAIYLIYGNKSMKEMIFNDQLKKLKINHSEQFKIYNFYSKEEFCDNDLDNYFGRINSSFIYNLMSNIEVPSKHYICGPIDFKNLIKESLNEYSVHPYDIFSEDFKLFKDPKDFEDVADRMVKISFQGNETVVEVNKGKSILEEALELNLELPYSCQTGTCSTCKATLLSGELKMIGLDKPRTDLNSDEFLLCCSYPLTDNVIVSI